MTIQGIDHLEMYVGDARQAAYLLCTGFGFHIRGHGGPETGLNGQRSVLVNQGGIWILLTSGLRPDHPATEYVARHGDGVAALAFQTTDTAATYTAALAGGANAVAAPKALARGGDEVVVATVSGFGDVAHRIVARRGPGIEFLPGLIDMEPATPPLEPHLLQVVDHIAVCLPHGALDATVDLYRQAFTFSEIFSEYVEVGEQGMDSRVVQSPSGGVTFTLLQPDVRRRRGQLDDYLEWHGGAGVQHIAFRTDNIVTAVRTLSARGVGFATTPAAYYDVLERESAAVDVPLSTLRDVGVLVDRDHWGQMFQIFTRSMHIRRTLFFELIERHGARTFGTSNIKALYEAKERELASEREGALQT